jgi:hypothetical protein
VPTGVHAVRGSDGKKGARFNGGLGRRTQLADRAHQTPTSFNRRASSASVCGGVYFAETRRRVLLSTTLASVSTSARSRDFSCRFFILCPVYASLRRTASLYNTRSDALVAQRLNAVRMSAVVLANAYARASSSSRSNAGAFPFPLLFPFRNGPAVGDAISTSCGEMGDFPFLGASLGEGSGSTAVSGNGPDSPVGIGDSTVAVGNLVKDGRAEIVGEGSEANELFADITSGLRISSAPEAVCEEFQPNRLLIDFCLKGGL